MRIEDILEACTRIRTYTETMDLDAFAQDQRTVDAVVRNLEIIGEAASSVPEDIQLRYGDLPTPTIPAFADHLFVQDGPSCVILSRAKRRSGMEGLP